MPTEILFDADFDSDSEGFVYRDDAFRGTAAPRYADGERLAAGGLNGGGLRVEIGGVNNRDVLDMSGGFERCFTLTSAAEVTLSFAFKMTHSSKYEADEYSELLVSLDGALQGTNGNDFVARITGVNGGGPDQVLGWQTVELDLGLLEAGEHKLIIGGFNNKKTYNNEETEILIDDVVLSATTDSDNNPPELLPAGPFAIDEQAFVAAPDGMVDAPGSQDGDVVGSVAATDADNPPDVLTFSIIGGSGAGAFAIDALTGEVSVADAAQLDFEANPSLTIDVLVEDGRGGQAVESYIIDLNDINDGPALLAAGPFAVADEAANGDSVGDVSASDEDQPADTLTYSIVGGSGQSAFAIDGASGEISVADASQIDFAAMPSFDLQVQVEDGNGGKDLRSYTVNVINPAVPTTLIDADFNTDSDGFSYRDDTFRGTNAPAYADGNRIAAGGLSGGALRVLIGGVNNSDVLGMSGGFEHCFTLTSATEVTLEFAYKMTHAWQYEGGENSELLVSIDGALQGTNGNDFVARIAGVNGRGPDQVVGWQTVELDLGLLEAGEHKLIIGGYNNKKTYNNEDTEILIDDVLLSANLSGGPTLVTPDPLPEPVLPGGISVEIAEFLQVPPTNPDPPLARLNYLYHADDGSGRLFVNDTRGKIYVIENGEILATPFLDLTTALGGDFIGNGAQQGIRTFAFHPDFENVGTEGYGKFYTMASKTEESAADHPDTTVFPSPTSAVVHHDVLSEWTIDPNDPNRIDVNSERELFRIAQWRGAHNAGQLAFNPNAQPGDADYGLLYIGVGDGGGQGDPFDVAQDRSNPLGSVLRIDPLESGGQAYSVPGDNPFVDEAGVLPEIWAYGFRNPQRFSWDTEGDGKLLLGDIGQDNIEEINLLVAGGNYGWGVREGTFAVDPDNTENLFSLPADDAQFGFLYPVAQYDHDEGNAIVGGFVYRGSKIPELVGKYVFGDIVNGRIFYVDVDDLNQGSQAEVKELTLLKNGTPTTLLQELGNDFRADLRFGFDEDGEIYILTKRDGVIRTLEPVDGGAGAGAAQASADPVLTFEDVLPGESPEAASLRGPEQTGSEPSLPQLSELGLAVLGVLNAMGFEDQVPQPLIDLV